MKTIMPKQTQLKLSVRLPQCKLWIDGKWRDSQTGKMFGTLNPATEDLIAEVAEGGEADVDAAVKAARKAFEEGLWPKMRANERASILYKMARIIRDNLDDLARLETMDSGKPIQNSRTIDIPAAADAFEYYAGWADKLFGETIPADPSLFTYTLREPLGVIGAITPWNFPMLMAAQKIAAALASGNAVVLKPAEQTPLTALRLAEIAEEAGLPGGVFNVVTGFGPTAGAALVRHPDVDGITFTGEYLTGQEIMKNAAGTLKRLSFELGGKSANIICADADLEEAAKFACEGIFFNQGEVCSAGSRVFVEERIKKNFTEALLEHSKKWQPGDPEDPKTELGAIVSKDQLNKILNYIKLGQKEGAKLILDGRKASRKKGFFLGPTIFDQATNDMRIAQEEIFGPVLAEISFKNFEDAIAQANRTFYGLAAAIWTKDIQKAHKAARLLKAGTVWVNTVGNSEHAVPFGGYKMSGTSGREGGLQTFDFYTQAKSVFIRLS